MRALMKTTFALLPTALVVAACSGGAPDRSSAALPADLQSDLALASAASVELAPRAANANVSGIEAVPAGKTTQADKAPKARPHPKAPRAQVAVARPAPTPEAAPAEEQMVAEDQQQAEDDAQAVADVAIAEAPAPEPEVVQAPQSRADPREGQGRGDDGWGDLIGVVLRGGHGGIDDCDPRTDGRGGVMIGSRFPVSVAYPRGGYSGGAYGGARPAPVNRSPYGGMAGSMAGERTRIGSVRSRGSMSGGGSAAPTATRTTGRSRL